MDTGQLVEEYLPLVGAIARTLSRALPPAVEMDDLVHDGVIGLISALRRFDPARKVGFSTYAGHRIRGAMLDGLRARDPLPRACRRAQRAPAGARSGRARTSVQLLEIDHAAGVPADDDTGPEAVILEADLQRRLWDGVAALPPRDREVVDLRMIQGLPLREAAHRLSLSITRTAEIQRRAITRLRRYLNGEPMIRRGGRYPRAGVCRPAAHRQQEQVPMLPNRPPPSRP